MKETPGDALVQKHEGPEPLVLPDNDSEPSVDQKRLLRT